MKSKPLPPLDPLIAWDRGQLKERECPLCEQQGQRFAIRPDSLIVNLCSQCGTFYLSPSPSEMELTRLYESGYYECQEAPRRSRTVDFRVTEIASIRDPHARRVLDVGCGWGTTLDRFRRLGADVLGIDLSAAAVRHVQHQLGNRAARVARLDDLPEHECFDAIIMFDFVEHPVDPLQHLRRARSLLRDKGLLAIWTPNASFVEERSDLLLFRVNLEHIQYLTARSCHWLAKELGLEIVHLESVGFAGRPASTIAGDGRIPRTSMTGSARRVIKSTIRAVGGTGLLSIAQSTIARIRAPNPRSGNYHLFCIFQA